MDYQQNKKYFEFITKLPKIGAIVITALLFVWSIVDLTAFSYSGRYYSYYGVMGLESGFLVWLIWNAIGQLLSWGWYYLSKLAICYKVLVVLNLEEISKAQEKLSNEQQ